MVEKRWTEEQADQAMRENRIENYVVEDGGVIVKRGMDEPAEHAWGSEK